MRVKLETFLREISEKTTCNNQYPALTSSKSGLHLQSAYFNKQVASKDNTGYKIIKRGQFTYRAMSDTGEFFPNMLDCADVGIVSPAYPVFEISKPDSIIPEFLKYFFKSNAFQYSISTFAQGSTRTSIKFGKLITVDIDLPNIDRQRGIVFTLDKVTKIIDSRKEELSKLDDLVKARFVEMFGNPITNTKGLETKSLKDVLVLKAGDFTAASDISTMPNEINKYPCYGGNGIRGYVAEYNQDGEYSLVGRQGALSGNVQYAKGQFKNTEHALLVTPIIELNSIWLNHLLISLDLRRYQTGAAQPGLSVKNLQEIQIITAPKKEQEEYADFVSQVDKSKVVKMN